MNNKAFTLIELIVVMAIIAILVLLAAPRFLGYTKDANVTAMEQDTKVLSDTAELYHVNTGKWPVSEKVTNHGIGGVDTVYRLNETELKNSIKNIKGDVDDYGIAIDGKYEGYVFHIGGVEDKSGKNHFGQGVYGSGMYSSLEIEGFMNKGYIPIATADDLNKVRENLGGNYIQIADIDLSSYSSGEGWEPIGAYLGKDNNENSTFTGVYDGGGFKITGLSIKRPSVYGQGLFGHSSGATLKNINVINGIVEGKHKISLTVGYAVNTKIENAFASGSIMSTGNDDRWSDAGGVAGMARESSITSSNSDVTVDGLGSIGSLIGVSNNSKITNSYAHGNVTGSYRVGGLMGNATTDTVITNSYSGADISGINEVGGLVGWNYSTTINNSYSYGNVIGTGESVGGLIGRNYSSSMISDSYYDSTTSGQIDINKGEPKTTVELNTKATFNNWDFNTVWDIQAEEYPTLREF